MGNAPPSPPRQGSTLHGAHSPEERSTADLSAPIEGVGVVGIASVPGVTEARTIVERLTQADLVRYERDQRAEADRLEQAKAALLLSGARRDAAGSTEEDLEARRKRHEQEANKAKERREELERRDERLAMLLATGLDEEEFEREREQAMVMEALVGVVGALSVETPTPISPERGEISK